MNDYKEEYNEHYGDGSQKNYWPLTIYMICAVIFVVWVIFG